jgi:hypothetical protein
MQDMLVGVDGGTVHLHPVRRHKPGEYERNHDNQLVEDRDNHHQGCRWESPSKSSSGNGGRHNSSSSSSSDAERQHACRTSKLRAEVPIEASPCHTLYQAVKQEVVVDEEQKQAQDLRGW